MKKGTGVHRLVGFVYALTMFGVLGSAMLIYNLTGDFGPFHILALVSLDNHLWCGPCASPKSSWRMDPTPRLLHVVVVCGAAGCGSFGDLDPCT